MRKTNERVYFFGGAFMHSQKPGHGFTWIFTGNASSFSGSVQIRGAFDLLHYPQYFSYCSLM